MPPPESPRQPNLCMKGRTHETMLRAVRDWHRELSRNTGVAVSSWAPSGLVVFTQDEECNGERRAYEIVELLLSEELREEGAAMQHCVASYASACAAGRTSIWSMRLRLGTDRTVRLATIAVRNRDRTIVQVRRQYNRPPTRRELKILARWEAAGGPKRALGLVPH